MKRRRRFSSIPLLSLLLATASSVTADFQPRYGQSSVYVNNTVYFLGGILSDTSLSTDFFSLDLSQEFNSSSPPWQNLTSLPVAIANAAAAIDAAGRVYLLGGQTYDCSAPFLNVYDPHTATWGTPQFFGTAPTPRQSARTFVSNDNEVIFYFGGSSTSCSTGTTTVYNTLNALSLQNSSWFNPANSNPPAAESNFALTKVNTGSGSSEQVLIIGGQTAAQNAFVQMSQVGLFDMGSQSWTFVTATTVAGQDLPEERVGHTAVTTSNGTVIVFGGTVGPSARAAVPQLAVLDTSSLPFQWSSPNVGGNASLGPTASLTGHSAIIDGDMMILAFGKDANGNFNQQPYFLDTNKMEWQHTYTPSKQSTSPSSPDSPSATPNSVNPNTHTTHINGAIPTSTTPESDDTSSSKTATIAVSTTVPLSLLALASAAVLIIVLRKRNQKRNRNTQRTSHQHLLSPTYEMSYISPSAKYLPPRSPRRGHLSKRVFKRIFSRGKAHASPPPNSTPPLGVFLPAWAQDIAREGGSNKSSSAHEDDAGVEDRMVQVASMSFMAPKMQLRVVNPDQESLDNFGEDEASIRRRISAGKAV